MKSREIFVVRIMEITDVERPIKFGVLESKRLCAVCQKKNGSRKMFTYPDGLKRHFHQMHTKHFSESVQEECRNLTLLSHGEETMRWIKGRNAVQKVSTDTISV